MYSITADLTIKGVTNTVNFPVEASVNNGLWLGTASFNIDRTLWGIQYNSGKFFSDLGDKVIDDMIDFKITIAVELPVTDNQSATTTQTTVEDVPVNQVTQ